MQKRLLYFAFAIYFAFLTLCLQLFTITQNESYFALSVRQSGKTVTLYTARGQIYDRDFNSLSEKNIPAAVVFPSEQNLAALRAWYAKASAQGKADAGGLTAPFVTTDISGLSGLPQTEIFLLPTRDASIAPHILGYLSDGAGVCGIEAAYNALLTENAQTAKAGVMQNGVGELLQNAEVSLSIPQTEKSGVVLTLDKRLQQIVLQAGKDMQKGAVVCIDAESGEILALASFPGYTDPGAALESADAPLYNRALAAYPVGSVFKPVIAAAALEQGFSRDMGFSCTGSTAVGDVIFRCHKRDGHGTLNMTGAIKESCNPYFIALSQSYPAEVFLTMAEAFGFAAETALCTGVKGAAGTLPTSLSPAELANFSFGQGELTATPLQVCAAYAAIANGGIYHAPTLIRGTTEDGATLLPETASLPERIIKEETAQLLQEMLYTAVMENDGANARPEHGVICGKTGTAQTGQYDENGAERITAWFAGWFSYQGREVAVTVTVEDAVSGNETAAPIAREIFTRAGG